MMLSFEPLFIVGFPRSGTTLLLHILRSTNAYPIYDFDETHYFSHYYLRYGDLSKKSQQNRLLAAVTDSEWFRKSGLVREEFFDSLKEQEITYPVVLARIMELIASKQEKMRWLEKTPWHILYISDIAKSYPMAKFIFIVRDPRSVVQSVCRAGWTQHITKGELRVAAAWRWHNMLAQKRFHEIQERHIFIKYEDLILYPEKVGRLLTDFLGVEIDIKSMHSDKLSALGKLNSSFRDSIEGLSQTPLCRWKQNMDPKLIAAVEFVVGRNCMEKFGYKPYAKKIPSYFERIWLYQYYLLYCCLKELRMILFPLVRR